MTLFFSNYLIADSIFNGMKSSDCKIPCLKSTSTIRRGPESTRAEYTAFYFAFLDEIPTKPISVDKFSFMESLNFLGSNLGLWPGLGIFQITEGAIFLLLTSKYFVKFLKGQ